MSQPLIAITGTTCTHPRYAMPMAAVAQRYLEALQAAGAAVLIVPPTFSPMQTPYLLERVDGVLLSGGGDLAPAHHGGQPHPKVYGVLPERDALELALARLAVERRVPLLGICRGIQVLNVALGGTLYEDLEDQMPNALPHRRDPRTERTLLAHEVTVAAESRLAAILGDTHLPVNSLHHQGIRDLAPGLRATAHAPDGLVEGVEVPEHPFALAVQWHPEWLYDTDTRMAALFRAFVVACQDHRGGTHR